MIDDLQGLAVKVLQKAVEDAENLSPQNPDHKSAILFINSKKPEWKEIRQIWLFNAFPKK